MKDIISWSNEAYKANKNQQNFIRNNIIETFKKTNTNHLFFRDKKNKKLIGYCKTQ
jgi:hypothetical protein